MTSHLILQYPTTYEESSSKGFRDIVKILGVPVYLATTVFLVIIHLRNENT